MTKKASEKGNPRNDISPRPLVAGMAVVVMMASGEFERAKIVYKDDMCITVEFEDKKQEIIVTSTKFAGNKRLVIRSTAMQDNFKPYHVRKRELRTAEKELAALEKERRLESLGVYKGPVVETYKGQFAVAANKSKS